MNTWKRISPLAALLISGVMPAATLMAQDTMTEDGVISGTMEIDFKTRSSLDTSGNYEEGAAQKGVQDIYTFDIAVAKTTQFTGKIVRQPNIRTKTLRKIEQGAALGFDITLSVLNPKDLKQKKAVGKWVGNVPINTDSGAYELAGAKAPDRPLRMAIDAVGQQKSFEDMFGGKLVGKAEKKDHLAAYTYKRLIGEKTVEFTVKKSDPMRFEGVELAKGPSENYPRTVVNGRLDYDYETGNWFTDGIRMKYSFNGKDFEDVITGSIKWVEDPARASNGKGHYEFNLRFNEDKNKSSSTEAAAFEKMSAEDAFFAVDDSIPSLTGSVDYVDTMAGEKVTNSKVTYNLKANKLTKQQVMNFFKLWTTAIGPTNDE